MPRLIKKYFKAKELRERGYSLKEISEKLNISKSTASVWLRDVKLSKNALKRLDARNLLGRVRSSNTKKEKRKKLDDELKKESLKLLDSVKINNDHLRLFCALLFECEGTKDLRGGIYFSNSDPELIRTFLTLLRLGFNIEERKLRILLHLHDYHSQQKQISFWSKVTGIPKSQFSKPYRKPHTRKRIKDNYQGCISVRYYDSVLARKLSAMAKGILNKYGRVR